MTPVRLEPAAPRSRVKHSTTEPLRSLTPRYNMDLDITQSCCGSFIFKVEFYKGIIGK